MLGLGNRTYSVNTFSFKIVTTSPNQSFTLPISGGGSGYVHRFVATWGDGASSTITAYNSNATHTYAVAGTYTILMTGRCDWFSFNNGGSKALIKELVSFTGDIGFKVLDFNGCSNLNVLVPLGTLASLTSATLMFYKCSALTSIPSGMFDKCPNITSFNQTFAWDSNITSIPTDLLRYHTKVTDYSYLFFQCSGITALPSGLLGSSLDATTYVMFQGTMLTSIHEDVFKYFTGAILAMANILSSQSVLVTLPANLFRYNTGVTSFAGVFQSCGNLVSLPAGLFQYNTAVTTFAYAFQQCMKLSSVVVDLFRYNTLVTTFYQTFNQCQAMVTVPVDIFKYNTAVTTFYATFQSCFNMTLTGDMFKYNINVTDFGYTFFNVKMGSLPAGLFRYNTLATSFYYTFANCSSLSNLGVDLFRYNVAANNFQDTFYYCSALHSLPAGFIGSTVNPDMSGIFTNCSITTLNAGTFAYFTGATTAFSSLFSNQTGLVSIPAGLFDTCVNVTSFSATFAGCSGLTTVPSGLFRFNTACLSFSFTFSYCIKLRAVADLFYAAGEQVSRFLNKSINFTNCFNRLTFTGVQGIAPDLWACDFGTGTPTKTHCYGGAGNSVTSLSNYASIPIDWE